MEALRAPIPPMEALRAPIPPMEALRAPIPPSHGDCMNISPLHERGVWGQNVSTERGVFVKHTECLHGGVCL